jgi:hypothetical protein
LRAAENDSEDESEPEADESEPEADDETIVTSKRPWRANRRARLQLDTDASAGRHVLTRRDLDWRPGTYGDLQRALHRLPGITGDTGNLSAFSIRGGEPHEAWVELDGIRIRYSSHLAGFTSLFDPDLVSRVEVHTGAPPPSLRSGLSGSVHVSYIDGPHDRVDGLLDLNFMQLSGHIAIDLDKREHGRAAVVVGARYSLLDLYLLAWKATGEIDPEFDTIRYVDAFVRTTFRPTSNDRVRVTGLFSTDRMLLDDVNEQTRVGGAAVDWQKRLDSATVDAGLAWSFNRKEEPDAGDFVYPHARQWAETEHRIEGRASIEARINDRVTLRAGGSGAAVHVRADGTFLRTSSLPTWAPLPLADYGLDEIEMSAGWWRPDVALWVQADARRLLGPLRVTAGLRMAVAGAGPTLDLEPRFAVALPLPTSTVLRASVGLVTQPRYEAEMLHPRYGNPDLLPERAVLADVSVSQSLPGRGVVRIAGFVKGYDRLIVSQGGPLPGDPLTAVPQGVVYTNDGRGWGAGMEASIEGRADRIGGAISYTLLRTKRTNPTALRFKEPIAPAGDQRHGLSASVDLLLGKRRNFRVSVLYLFKSGRPIADLASVPDGDDTWTWRIVDVGARRFPSAHRLNLRLEHTFVRKQTAEVKPRKTLVRGIFEINSEPSGSGFVENCDSVRDEDGKEPVCAPFGFLPVVRPWLGLKVEW